MNSQLTIFNFHGIESASGEYPWIDVETPYVISKTQFKNCLESIRSSRLQLLTVKQLKDWRAGGLNDGSYCMLTFDDGHQSHAEHAAEVLSKFGFPGLFFISAGHIGEQGLLSVEQIKHLSKSGFDIGSHGYHHKPYSDIPDDELRFQVAESKRILESITRHPINTFSIPRGFYQKRIADAAFAAGYCHLFTSQFGINTQDSGVDYYRRIVIRRDITADRFTKLMRGDLGIARYTESAKAFARQHIPPAIYDIFVHAKLRLTKTRNYEA